MLEGFPVFLLLKSFFVIKHTETVVHHTTEAIRLKMFCSLMPSRM